MRIGFLIAATVAILWAQPVLAEDLALPEPGGVTAALPQSSIPMQEEARSLPEPETEPIAPYAKQGCRERGETVYLTN